MSMVTTEFTVQYSGVTGALVHTFSSEKTIISGGNVTVASGAAVLNYVHVWPTSGGQASWSGVIINIADAVSGMYVAASGNVILHQEYGAQRGISTAGMPVAHPTYTDIGQICKSGITVSISGTAGLRATVGWSKLVP